MVGEDRVLMSGKELRRVHVIHQVLGKQITPVKAGALLGLTARQQPDHKPDISTLGGSGHFYLGLTTSRLHLDSLFNPLVDCPVYGRLTHHSPLAGLVIE